MTFLRKVQKSNLFYRKLIFWVIMIILALVSGIFFLRIARNRLQNIGRQDFLKDSKILNINQEIKKVWPKEMGQEIKEEFNSIKEILEDINEELKKEQDK